MSKLIDKLPMEYRSGEWDNDPVAKYENSEVIKEFSLGESNWRPWPGKHRNVVVWWILETGQAVAWNENCTNRGWSFPVIGKRKLKQAGVL